MVIIIAIHNQAFIITVYLFAFWKAGFVCTCHESGGWKGCYIHTLDSLAGCGFFFFYPQLVVIAFSNSSLSLLEWHLADK